MHRPHRRQRRHPDRYHLPMTGWARTTSSSPARRRRVLWQVSRLGAFRMRGNHWLSLRTKGIARLLRRRVAAMNEAEPWDKAGSAKAPSAARSAST